MSGRDDGTCHACGAALPPSFPGATVTCVCGHRISVAPATPAPSASGPYRSASSAAEPYAMGTCPYCMNRLPPLVRVCPHCDVRLDTTRCGRCFSLQGPGSFACARCGNALELEPLLDPTDAPCPRCRTPLEAAGDDTSLAECARCGGIFVQKDELARILANAEIAGPFAGRAAPGPVVLSPVRYVTCPLCHGTMNRVNFGRLSGAIVDVCRVHGTWFDAGELTRVVAFVASGGLEKTRMRELTMRQEEKDKLAAEHAKLLGERLHATRLGRAAHGVRAEDLRTEAMRRMLESLFRS